MEGATVTTLSHPVNIDIVYTGLLKLTHQYSLLNITVTNFSILHCMTVDAIKDAYQLKLDSNDLLFNLLKIWFPSLTNGLQYSSESWSHYWDLDLEVQSLLRDAGYPMIDVDGEDKDSVDEVYPTT